MCKTNCIKKFRAQQNLWVPKNEPGSEKKNEHEASNQC